MSWRKWFKELFTFVMMVLACFAWFVLIVGMS